MNQPNADAGSASDFFREVARYFMDFLETDFHKRKTPRRSILKRNPDNLLVGVDVSKYKQLRTQITKHLRGGFQSDLEVVVRRGQYRTELPERSAELIQRQVDQIESRAVDQIIQEATSQIRIQVDAFRDEVDVAIQNSSEATGTTIYETLVHPLVSSLSKPLQNAEVGDDSSIFQIEQELTDVILNMVDSTIADLVTQLAAGERPNPVASLESRISVDMVRSTIKTFFGNLQIGDLHQELVELERNRSILDKQDLYLYVGEIAYKKNRFPLFYVPLQIEKLDDAFILRYDSQLYLNKKAIEFVVQEVNAHRGISGALQSTSERIYYLSQLGTTVNDQLAAVVTEICEYFRLPSVIDLGSSSESTGSSPDVAVRSSLHLALFDKSDEALVNDYEEILKELALEGGELSEAFQRILQDFLLSNPEAFNRSVEDHWDELSSQEKLVALSPIPLNSEQRQILNAVNQDGCKYLIVEGPPGTGKSHTITAIIFDAVMNSRSVLVLSDKKEALDVVEKNITETMNQVRFDQKFQNPILRLGKTGSTYSQILAKGAINDIKIHHRAVKQEAAELDSMIVQLAENLKEDLELEAMTFAEIGIRDIFELEQIEDFFTNTPFGIDTAELESLERGPECLEELYDSLRDLAVVLTSPEWEMLRAIQAPSNDDIEYFITYFEVVRALQELLVKLRSESPRAVEALKQLPAFDQFTLDLLENLIRGYESAHSGIFGYLFSGSKVRDLHLQARKQLGLTFNGPKEALRTLNEQRRALRSLKADLRDIQLFAKFPEDLSSLAYLAVKDPSVGASLKLLSTHLESVTRVSNLSTEIPQTLKHSGLSTMLRTGKAEGPLVGLEPTVVQNQVRRLLLRQRMHSAFEAVPDVRFGSRKSDIERLVTTKVTHLLDDRVIQFYENYKNDAEMLRSVIKSKQKFPRSEFSMMKNAFPCILAGIRDFAEYIPLQNQMFDLLIIDEASQVSLAQAFPALLRARKVLILGDRKQFSNVKAAQARSATNSQYLYGLERSFRLNVSQEVAQLTRLGKFNIKTSVLEFFEFISNYNIQLLKYFRGYKEIISYSNKYFYGNTLQVMKFRAKPIDEVLKFTVLEPTPEDVAYPNSNLAEIRFIQQSLLDLLKSPNPPSVGIITPHTNQQKLLVAELSKLPEYSDMQSRLNLKIMTFDTCQGEERDLIFYSMVASKHADHLIGVFIKDLLSVDIEEEGQIKAQRLNVGFSRGKETLHFVLSKPLDEFTGSIGEALRHYANELATASRELDPSTVDPKSPREAEVLQWFYQTSLWKSRSHEIVFTPQFEIGKYLKQLDPRYSHPEYKVDFLVAVRDPDGRYQKLVIEYDGFYEHFRNYEDVNELNYEQYLSDADIYRQKVLESYGYKFIRINKFNVGANPVKTLDERLRQALKPEPTKNLLMSKILDTVSGLSSGQTRECPKCHELRSDEDFKDPARISGYGRFCRSCKASRTASVSSSSRAAATGQPRSSKCPKCGSSMVRRSGRYGTFFGCSRYPYCKGTR